MRAKATDQALAEGADGSGNESEIRNEVVVKHVTQLERQPFGQYRPCVPPTVESNFLLIPLQKGGGARDPWPHG